MGGASPGCHWSHGTWRTVSQLRTGASALANVLVTGQGPRTALRCRFLTLLTLPGTRNKIFLKSGPSPAPHTSCWTGPPGHPPSRTPSSPASLGSALTGPLGTPLPGLAYLQAPWGWGPPPRLYPECPGRWVTLPDIPLPSGNLRKSMGAQTSGLTLFVKYREIVFSIGSV